MKSRWIVGGGEYLEQVYQAWKAARPDEAVVKIEIPQSPDYEFDLSVLDECDPAAGSMFVAFDERFGNFKRMELMQVAMERGFALEPFISTHAAVADDAMVGPNVFVGPNVSVGSGVRIEFNCVLHAGANVGYGARLRSSCWLEPGVIVGANADVGAHCTLRSGALVAPKVKVGRGSELGWPRLYREDVPSRTVYDPRYDEPIFVYGT